MSHYKKKSFWKNFLESYIPNKRDNFKQIAIKILFIASFVTLLISAGYIANHFITAEREENIIEDARAIWYAADTDAESESSGSEAVDTRSPEEILTGKNSDFKGWLRLSGAGVDHPVYQTDNNSYYLNHNQNKKKSVYGALYFDYENIITENKRDRNLIIYGHEMNNGSMFGSLKKLRNLSFYKENSTVELTLFGRKSVYRIYSLFVLNASEEDDDGYVYNIFKQNFVDNDEFTAWLDEAYDRSIIDTNVEVEFDDEILTLVTCSEDFDNARLIVMAKKLDANEDKSPKNYDAHTNSDPRYPAKWYEERGIER